MNGHRKIAIGGELHLSLQVVAECYRVELAWLRDAFEIGLLVGHREKNEIVIAAGMMDRVAEIVRLHVYYRLDLSAITLVLGHPDREFDHESI